MRHPLVLVLATTLLAGHAAGATYQVGPGRTWPTLAGLPSLAPGDVVAIDPGTYREVKRWTDAGTAAAPITIRGVGGARPVIDGAGFTIDGVLPRGRAVFQIEASHVVVEHLEFVAGRNGTNGAGIRVTGFGSSPSGVVVRDCRLHDCDMGVQDGPCDDLLMEGCEIDRNGSPTRVGYSHNTYFGGNAVTVRGCWIHDALDGLNVKSRAHFTALLYNWIADSADGEVDLVDDVDTAAADSNAVMIGNVVVSKASRGSGFNSARFIHFGQDSGGAHPGTLYAYGNTFVAGNGGIVFLDPNAAESAIVASGNVFAGSLNVGSGNAGGIGGTGNWFPSGAAIPGGFTASLTGADPGFVDAAARDFHLVAASPARGLAPMGLTYRDGYGATHPGAPTLEYLAPATTIARADDGDPDAGAYEYAGGGGTTTAGTTTGGTTTGGTTTAGTTSGSTTGGTTGGTGDPGGGRPLGCGAGAAIATAVGMALALRGRRG